MKCLYKSQPYLTKAAAIKAITKMHYIKKLSKDKWQLTRSGTILFVNSLNEIIYNYGK